MDQMKHYLFVVALLLLSWNKTLGQESTVCQFGTSSVDEVLKKLFEEKSIEKWEVNDPDKPLVETLLKAAEFTCDLPDTLLAHMLHKMGVAYINPGRNFSKGVRFYHQALSLRMNHLPPSHPDIVKGFTNVGSCYLAMTQNGLGYYLDSAEWALKKSIELNLMRKEPTNYLGRSYWYLGRVMREKNDAVNERLFFEAAIEQFEADSTQRYASALTHNYLSQTFALSLNDPQAALFHIDKAISFYENPEGALPSANDSIRLSGWYETKATAYLKMDDLGQAAKFYQRALSLLIPYKKYVPARIAAILNNQAIIHNRQSQYAAAIAKLQEAIPPDSSGAAPALAGNYDNLGDAYLGLNQLDDALQAYQKAIAYFAVDFDSHDPKDNPPIREGVFYDPQGLVRVLASKGRVYLRRYQEAGGPTEDLLQAYRAYRAADSLIHRLRRSYYTMGSKQALVTLTKPIYEAAIETCLALYQATDEPGYRRTAFELAESSKAVILWDAVAQTRDIRSLLSSSQQARLRGLRERRVYYEKSLAANADSELALRDSLIKYRQLEAEFLDRLAAQGSRAGGVWRDLGGDPEQGRDWQSTLGADQALIEYFVGEDQIFLFLLTRDALQVQRLAKDFPLDAWVAELREYLYSEPARDNPEAYLPRFYERSSQLYERLIAPLGDLSQLPQRLTVVRDGVLELIPFSVLLPEAAPGQGLAQAPYLGRDKAISYAFSARLRRTFQRNQVRPSRALLAMAPVDFEQTRGKDSLGTLAYTAAAVQQVPLAWPDLYLREEATLSRFVSEAERYAILYLASHGFFEEADPRFNGIAFYDSVLYTADLYPMVLNAELVVLSACESGVGTLVPGEGMISLGYGFAQAGARSVLATQWKVSEGSSVIPRFLELLDQGLPKDVALHRAQQERLDLESPYYWAAYEIRGALDPIELPKGYPWQGWAWWALAMGLGLTLGGGLWWWRSRTQPG